MCWPHVIYFGEHVNNKHSTAYIVHTALTGVPCPLSCLRTSFRSYFEVTHHQGDYSSDLNFGHL